MGLGHRNRLSHAVWNADDRTEFELIVETAGGTEQRSLRIRRLSLAEWSPTSVPLTTTVLARPL